AALDIRAAQVDPEIERRGSGRGTHRASPTEVTQEVMWTVPKSSTLRVSHGWVNRPTDRHTSAPQGPSTLRCIDVGQRADAHRLGPGLPQESHASRKNEAAHDLGAGVTMISAGVATNQSDRPFRMAGGQPMREPGRRAADPATPDIEGSG